MSQQTSLIPVFTGNIQDAEVQMCDARTLHKFLQVGRLFGGWISGRIEKYGFVEGYDYVVVKTAQREEEVFSQTGKNLGGRPQTDYHLTLDMAKELAMVENNDKGREVRRYFIACERELLAHRPVAQLSAPYAVLPGQTITAEQADQLRDMLQEAADTLPEEQRKKFMIQGWSKLKAHFHVEYRKIPAQHFNDAISLFARHIASYQPDAVHTLPAPQQTLPLKRLLICSTLEGDTMRTLSDDEVIVSKSALDALKGGLAALTLA